MKIAVCDDEIQELRIVEKLLTQYAPDIPVKSFSSAKELLAAMDETFYPLIFLDIEMQEPNGFRVAEELMSKERKPLIVFVTKSHDYSIRGYDVAFHYLVKPICEEKFKEVLDRALRILTPRFFSFSADGEVLRIPLQEIIYFESQKYTLFVHTTRGVYRSRISLREISSQLSGAEFFRIHASYLVNMDHITKFSKDTVELSSGETLRVSRLKKHAFDEAFSKFIRETL